MKISSSKSLLALRFLNSEQLLRLINSALELKKSFTENQHPRSLSGQTILNLFFEPSTRTRVSFETAVKRLGGSSVALNLESSSVKKGETLFDTIKNLDAMGFDGIVVRHRHAGVPHFVDNTLGVPVINAGDGFNEHPSQGLLDVFTMIEKQGTVTGKNVLILGDILHSRVARSNIWALKTLGANVFVAGPPTLIPAGIEHMGAIVVPDLAKAIPHMDFINVLRIQYERQDLGYFPTVREYRDRFGLTLDRLQHAKPTVNILHPGPINRGIEIDSDVADGPHNVILDQVANGVIVRMAILQQLLSKGGPA